MEQNQNKPSRGPYKIKAPSRGGARAGAGRKPGSSPRYTLEELVNHVEHHAGMSFAERVAINYVDAINRNDWNGVRDYDRILLGKMVADKQEVEVTNTQDTVEAKAQAFADAMMIVTKRSGVANIKDN